MKELRAAAQALRSLADYLERVPDAPVYGVRRPSGDSQVMGHRAVVRGLLGLAAFIGLAGCAVSDPTQYYALGQTATARRQSARAAGSSVRRPREAARRGTGAVGIGVGPVIMPGYLDRIQIVTRTGADRVELATFHRWAEPLETGSPGSWPRRSAPASRPSGSSCSRGEASSPGPSSTRWSSRCMRFDGRLGGDVTLDTRWRILGKRRRRAGLQAIDDDRGRWRARATSPWSPP